MNNSKQENDTFLPLHEFNDVRSEQHTSAGNVIKKMKTRSGGTFSIETKKNMEGEPKININRIDETIESIEFICTCGRKAEVRFEYDE
jgi:hypothetical protein